MRSSWSLSRGWAVLSTLIVSASNVVACSSEALPDFGASPFWAEIHLDGARDLGHEARPLTEAERRKKGEIRFVDVTETAGLGDARSGGNSHGVGIAFVDVTQDLLPDIFVANGKSVGFSLASRLYRNNADGTFSDITDDAGLGVLAGRDSFSVAAGDYDNDNDVDLYVGALPRDVLLQNQGDGTFRDATAAALAGGPDADASLASDGRGKVVSFGDFDGDGWLDLASSSSMLPSPGAYLLRNRSDGTFEDVSARTGVKADPSGNPCAVMWSDYDTDGDADLWIWNDRGGHILLANERGERLTDVTKRSRLDQVSITHPMGIDAGDIDHDGDLDYYISNIGDNPLLRNNGDGTFVDITQDAGTGGVFGWGLSFEDLDSDGWTDLFVAQEDNLPFLVFRNRAERPPLFERLELEHPRVLDEGLAHNVAAAFADFDRDGRVDAVLAETDGSRVVLYRNVTEIGSHRWLHVSIEGAPGDGNRGGISARVAVKTGDIVQFEDVVGGSSRASQNELSARFGLGDWTGAEWVVVLWPSGEHTVLRGVEGNQSLLVRP